MMTNRMMERVNVREEEDDVKHRSCEWEGCLEVAECLVVTSYMGRQIVCMRHADQILICNAEIWHQRGVKN